MFSITSTYCSTQLYSFLCCNRNGDGNRRWLTKYSHHLPNLAGGSNGISDVGANLPQLLPRPHPTLSFCSNSP